MDQQRRASPGDALEPSSHRLRRHSLPFVQTVASPGSSQLPCRLAGSPRGPPALGLWGCYGGVSTRAGVCQTPRGHVWDEGLWYPGNGTALIPGPRVGLLELQRPGQRRRSGSLPEVRAQCLGPDAGRPRLPRSPSACQPIGSCLSTGPYLLTSLTSQATWCSTAAGSASLEIFMLHPSGPGSRLGLEHPSSWWEENRCRGRWGYAANRLC